MKISLIGKGYWGKNWERLLKQTNTLYQVSDTPQETDNILKSDADAIVIATPAETHAEIAYNALLRGKHVLCEKPFALNINDAERCLEMAQMANLVLMIGHTPQYHEDFISLKENLHKIGRIKYIWSNRLNDGKWRKEGVVWSFAPHDVSMIHSLLGLPNEVNAFGNKDTCLCMFKYHNAGAHIFVSWNNPFKEQRLVVVGEKGMLEFNGSKQPETEPLLKELIHFIQCTKSNKEPITSGFEALNVTKTLYAINQSIKGN